MVQLGHDPGIELMDGIREFLKACRHLRAMDLDQGLPWAVIGVHSQFPYNDQSASTLGASLVVGNMAFVQATALGEVGPVGQQTNAVG
jgi:hypothetical protein